MVFKDPEKAKQILNTAIPCLEKLGVCVATFVGGGAMYQFNAQVFPLLPQIPSAIGFLLVAASLFLAILVAGETWRAMRASIKSRWLNFAVLLVILLSSLLFVIAGGAAAFKAL